MTTPSFKRSVLLALVVSGSVFSIATAPLALYRTQPIKVHVKNAPFFEAELSAIAGPYMTAVGLFNLALGAGILGFSGWRAAAAESERMKTHASTLERQLTAYKTQLERVQFSEARLQDQGLETFLSTAEASPSQYQPSPQMPAAATKGAEAPVVSILAGASRIAPLSPMSPSRVGNSCKAEVLRDLTPAPLSPEQLESMFHQLQALTVQVEGLQAQSAQSARCQEPVTAQ